MIPVLYPPNATDFSTFGIGVLTDTISCEVTEERNGVFEPVSAARKAPCFLSGTANLNGTTSR